MEYRIRKDETNGYAVEYLREFIERENLTICWSVIKYFPTLDEGIGYLKELKSVKDFSNIKTDDIVYHEEI